MSLNVYTANCQHKILKYAQNVTRPYSVSLAKINGKDKSMANLNVRIVAMLTSQDNLLEKSKT